MEELYGQDVIFILTLFFQLNQRYIAHCMQHEQVAVGIIIW